MPRKMPTQKPPSDSGFFKKIKNTNRKTWFFVFLTIFVMLVGSYMVMRTVLSENAPGATTNTQENVIEPIESYNDLLGAITAGHIAGATVDSNRYVVEGTLTDETKFSVAYPASHEENLVNQLLDTDVPLSGKQTVLPKSFFAQWIFPGPVLGLVIGNENTGGFPSVFPTILIVSFLLLAVFLILKAKGRVRFERKGFFKVPIFSRDGDVGDVGDLINPDDGPLTFDDVAGNEGPKEALAEILEMLEKPRLFRIFGAKIPKGIMFFGPPGTGKTLMARVLGTVADIPILIVSGSEFMELYVGTGPKAVRKLYARAKKLADKYGACIVFIDEVDSLGKVRGVHGDNGEERRTISAMLTALDGATLRRNPVITIAATNRLEDIDEAFKRKGRFDEQVAFQLPRKTERRDILDVHTRKKLLAQDIDLLKIAGLTEGFNGADLEALANKAAIMAARRANPETIAKITSDIDDDELFTKDVLERVHEEIANAGEAITHEDLREAITQIMAGREKTDLRNASVKEITAWHEGAHAIIAMAIVEVGDPKEITILPRTGGSGGHVIYSDEEDTFYLEQNKALAELAVGYGGLVIEKMRLGGKHTSGPSGDMQMVAKHIRHGIYQFGWSDKLGSLPVTVDELLSEETKALAESEVRRISEYAETVARLVIERNYDVLETAVPIIMQEETIRDEDLITKMFEGFTPLTIEEIEAELAERATKAEKGDLVEA